MTGPEFELFGDCPRCGSGLDETGWCKECAVWRARRLMVLWTVAAGFLSCGGCLVGNAILSVGKKGTVPFGIFVDGLGMVFAVGVLVIFFRGIVIEGEIRRGTRR